MVQHLGWSCYHHHPKSSIDTCKMSASSPTLARADVATKTAYRMISSGSARSSFLSLSRLLTKPYRGKTHLQASLCITSCACMCGTLWQALLALSLQRIVPAIPESFT